MNSTFRQAYNKIVSEGKDPQRGDREPQTSGRNTRRLETPRRSLSDSIGKLKQEIISNLLQEFNPYEDQSEEENFNNESWNGNTRVTRPGEACRIPLIAIKHPMLSHDAQTTLASQDLENERAPDDMTEPALVSGRAPDDITEPDLDSGSTSDDITSQWELQVDVDTHSSTESFYYIYYSNGLRRQAYTL